MRTKGDERKTDKRLPLYLPGSLYQRLKARADSDGVSVAETVRRAGEAYVAGDPGAEIRQGYRKLRQITGLFRDREGKTDTSLRHDEHFAQSLQDERETKWRGR